MASPRAEAGALAGWHVLVTRPDGLADALCRALAAAGARVAQAPLLAIEPLPATPAMRAIAADLDRYDFVVVTSRHAVQYALPLLADRWPQWPVGQQWIAVGAGTADALAAYDIVAVAPADPRSEGLLALPALAAVGGRRVLMLTGEGGRGLIDRTLTARGAQVARLDAYRRRAADGTGAQLAAFRRESAPPRAVLVTSGDALQNLLGLAPWLRDDDTHCVVASERIGELARAAGLSRVTVADGAGDDAMLAALQRLAAQRTAAG